MTPGYVIELDSSCFSVNLDSILMVSDTKNACETNWSMEILKETD